MKIKIGAKIGTAAIFIFLMIQGILLLSGKTVAVPIFPIFPVFAQEIAAGFEEIKLYIGEPFVLPSSNAKRIAVARPEVADVHSVAADEVVLEPKAPGVTSLFIWDDYGQHAYQLKVLSEDFNLIKERLDSIISELGLLGVFAKVNEAEGKVLLIGEVSELNDKERLLSALGSLRDKTLDLIQIKEEETTLDIAVQVLEMNRDSSRTLGFTMPSSVSVSEPPGRFSSALRASMDAIFHVFDWPRANDFTAKIDALVEEGKARVLSSPRLACQSGKEAELLVGGEKPILTTQSVSGGGTGTQVQYKEFGIKLKIKPTVVEKERIKVALNIEVSEVGTAEILGAVNAPTAKAFPLTKRNASTELFLDSGQTLGIGGLVKEKEESAVRKIAFLGDIPIVGLLFRKKESKMGGGTGEKGNIELVILLTPTIMRRSSLPAAETTDKGRRPESLKQSPAGVSDKKLPNSESALGAYAGALKSRISASIDYPSLARELNLKGELKLRLRILADGQLKDTYVLKSSGSELLDSAAINTIKKLAPFAAFPSSLDDNEIVIDIPIVYS